MKKWFAIILSALLCMTLFSGCGGSGAGPENLTSDFVQEEYSEYDAIGGNATEVNDFDGSIIPENSKDVNGESTDNQTNSRKLARTFDVDGEVQNFDDFVTWLNRAVSDAGGYIQESSNDMYNESKTFSGTVRIPDDKADGFLDGMDGIVNIRRQSVMTDDITLRYSDTKASVDSLRIEQETLQDMLSRAETVADTIQIQDRLSSVRQAIESYESALRLMDSQVDYATICLFVSEVVEYTEPLPDTWWGKATKGFLGNCQGVIDAFQAITLFVFVNIPWFIVIAVIVVIILLATRKSRARNRAIREANKKALEDMRAAQQLTQK